MALYGGVRNKHLLENNVLIIKNYKLVLFLSKQIKAYWEFKEL